MTALANLSQKILGDLISFRRDIHRHPELGFDVQRTSNEIANLLLAAGLAVEKAVGGSGIVATLTRGNPGKSIGLRADMDALPITELNSFDHCSVHPGKFHGCGHDGHSTMLLGAALQLANDTQFNGTVHFIFQPDEENGTGADAMIDDGLFERFPMDAVYGLHNLPGLALGSFAIQSGAFCSFEDNFKITVRGRGGHSSMPDKAIDALTIGARIVLDLQTIVSQSIPAADHAVVSVTGFKTNGARHVLSGEVIISGDCRGFASRTSQSIENRMGVIVDNACAAWGASAIVDYSTSFVPLLNHEENTAICARAASQVPDATVDDAYGRVGFSEDFAKMLVHRPGAYILMGNGESGNHHGQALHNANYDFNDEAIPYGVAYWCSLAKL